MPDLSAQSQELLIELDLSEQTANEMDWDEQEFLDTLDEIRKNALAMPMVDGSDAPSVGKLSLSAYELITALREWRLDMQFVMDRVPTLKKKEA